MKNVFLVSRALKVGFDRLIDAVFALILLFIILGIVIGTYQLCLTTWSLFSSEGMRGEYIDLIADVLTLYVLIELSRSLVEYFHTHRLRLTFIVDAAIVFILREILIALFKHKMTPDMLYALSALLFVLGALRIASVLVYQREKKLAKPEEDA